MESTTTRAGVDLAARRTYPGLALALALISVPGSMLTWDTLPGGGFVFGLPFAVAGIVLGVRVLQGGESDRAKATAAIAIGAAVLALMVVWTIVESL
jgi:hypothetical protein